MPNKTFLFGTFLTLIITMLVTSFTLIVITWFFTNAVPVLQQTIDNMNFEGIENIKHLIDGTPVFSTFDISNINWLMFAYGITVSIVMTSLLAIFIGTMFKSVRSFTVLTLTYLILFIALGGLAIPVNVINQSDVLTVLSGLIPNTHTNNLMISAMNNGHIESAKAYVAYSNAMCDWLAEIYDANELGVFAVDGAGAGIGAVVDNLGHPELEDWMSDPLESGIVPSAWPWLEGWMQSISDLFLNIDIPSRSEFFVYFAYIGSGLVQTFNGSHLFNEGFAEVTNNLYSFYNGVSVSLAYLQQKSAFDFTTTYAVLTNVIPLLLSLLLLPNFILIGREE